MTKNPYYYIGANPTVDLIVLNPDNKILLVLRGKNSPACPNQWALPGGFVDTISSPKTEWKETIETPAQAALRELAEETNLTLDINTNIQFINTYEGNQRDPRDNEESWSKSHAFFYKIPQDIFELQKDKLIGMSDIEEIEEITTTKWFSLDEINQIKLAFDHNQIIKDGINKYIHPKSFKM